MLLEIKSESFFHNRCSGDTRLQIYSIPQPLQGLVSSFSASTSQRKDWRQHLGMMNSMEAVQNSKWKSDSHNNLRELQQGTFCRTDFAHRNPFLLKPSEAVKFTPANNKSAERVQCTSVEIYTTTAHTPFVQPICRLLQFVILIIIKITNAIIIILTILIIITIVIITTVLNISVNTLIFLKKRIFLPMENREFLEMQNMNYLDAWALCLFKATKFY